MSPPKDDESIDDRMFRLERRARVVRSRLLRAVDALDARRHQVQEIGRRAKRVAVPAVAAIVGVAVLAGVGAVAFGVAVARRRRRSVALRLSSGLSSAVTRAARRFDAARQPSLPRRMFDRVAVTIAAFAAGEVAKRLTRNVVDGRFADGRLAVGRALARHHDGMQVRVLSTNGSSR